MWVVTADVVESAVWGVDAIISAVVLSEDEGVEDRKSACIPCMSGLVTVRTRDNPHSLPKNNESTGRLGQHRSIAKHTARAKKNLTNAVYPHRPQPVLM
jgi:hypothetical protein